MFDDVFLYLKTISKEMMVTHDGYLKRFILTKPRTQHSDIEGTLNTILGNHRFKGRLAVKEQYGYIKIIYCFEEGLRDPELIKYFDDIGGD